MCSSRDYFICGVLLSKTSKLTHYLAQLKHIQKIAQLNIESRQKAQMIPVLCPNKSVNNNKYLVKYAMPSTWQLSISFHFRPLFSIIICSFSKSIYLIQVSNSVYLPTRSLYQGKRLQLEYPSYFPKFKSTWQLSISFHFRPLFSRTQYQQKRLQLEYPSYFSSSKNYRKFSNRRFHAYILLNHALPKVQNNVGMVKVKNLNIYFFENMAFQIKLTKHYENISMMNLAIFHASLHNSLY